MQASGIYVHIPFCQKKCAYCDFASYAGGGALYGPYLEALRREMCLAQQNQSLACRTLYVGGGTPTVLPTADLRVLIVEASQVFGLAPDAEVTVEANPGTVDAASLHQLRDAGVCRLSLGVQSFDPAMLHTLGRIHTAEQARQAVREARVAGFDNLNLDLIFGLPGQTMGQWQESVRQALALSPEHLSLYALTVEKGTPLASAIEAGALPIPDEDLAADMYTWAEDALSEVGMVHYEISNWALPRRPCQHNLVYWRNQPYVGLGAAAHSWYGGLRSANLRAPGDYIAALQEGRSPVAEQESIDRALEMGETMMMGLRLLQEGVSFERFARRFGVSMDDVYGPQIERLVSRGLLERMPDRIRLARRGYLLGNQVFAEFLLPKGHAVCVQKNSPDSRPYWAFLRRVMDLKTLLSDLPQYHLTGGTTVEVTGVTPDSRQVEPGSAFVAYPGEVVDGHRFIPQAIERGAAALVGEQARMGIPDDVPYVQVPNGREALAYLSAAWHGHPSRDMTVLGVTGTDGKTTTVNLLQSIFKAAGHKTGMVSTVNAVIGDRYRDTGLHVTTPDAPVVQALLAEMRDAGTEVVILEATSIGLAHHRVTAVDFDVAAVTNVTHAHLNFHGTWERYCADKARLFHMLSTSWRKPAVPKVAVTNADDRSYSYLRPIPADVQLAYAVEAEADLKAVDICPTADGQTFVVRAPQISFPIRTPLVGRYNVYNVLAAVSVALALDVPIQAIQRGIGALAAVTGRMERIDEGQDFTAIVDFAHTPFALEQALKALRPQTEARLIVVFGCAGERDVEKRGMMGRAAGALADVTVITAEDPRTEDLDGIIEQIAQGVEAAGAREGEGYIRVPDRGEAIAAAIQMAESGDIVVAAGKGHEQSMCFGTVEYPWDDRVAMRAALLERLGRPGEVIPPRLPTSRA